MRSNYSKAELGVESCQSGARTRRIVASAGSELLGVGSVGALPADRRGRIELEEGEITSRAARAQVGARNPASRKTGHEPVHISKSQRNHWFSQGGSGSGWCLDRCARFLALPFLVLKGPRP